jgi:surfeit locus 1 family protein
MNPSHHKLAERQQPFKNANWRVLPRTLISRRWRWVTLGVIVLSVIMLRLGVWQLDRLGQRRAENARIEQRLNSAPLALTGQPLDLVQDEYRRVTVRGTFDHSNSVLLRNRARQGDPGMHLLTPLRIENSDQAVLVDRGWLPLDATAPETRQQFDVAGTVEIQGIVRAPKTRTSPISAQDRVPEDGRLDAWYRPDVARIAAQMPYPLLPFYVEAEQPPDQPPGLPRPDPQIDLSNGPHLNYALQWLAFTITLLGGYAAFVATRPPPAPTTTL